MPLYQPPTNDEARLANLKRAAVTGSHDKDAGKRYITDQTHNQIMEFIPGYEEGIHQTGAIRSNRSTELRESTEAYNFMKTCMRDMWESIRRKVNRLNLPAEVLTYYELPMDGHSPNPTTYEAWYVTAGKMVEGATKAVAKGYPPVLEPSVEELKEAREKALAERGDVSTADDQYDEAQGSLDAMRSRAEELIEDIMAELRFHLRKLDEPSQRRIMRRYGADFKYLKNEPEDEPLEEEME